MPFGACVGERPVRGAARVVDQDVDAGQRVEEVPDGRRVAYVERGELGPFERGFGWRMKDKTMTADEVVSRLESGMTLGIGGWGSRRKPMALVRALLRSPVTDLTVVSYGGPDIGMLAAAGRIRTLVAAFVTLDTIPLEPHYRAARESGALELQEVDEAMFMWGLQTAANRLPFVPVRAGIGSDVMRAAPSLRTVTSPYADRWPSTVRGAGAVPDRQEEFVAVPALRMDAALVHVNRADRLGNGQYLGPDPYFDDLFCEAADSAYVSSERIVDTADLTERYGRCRRPAARSRPDSRRRRPPRRPGPLPRAPPAPSAHARPGRPDGSRSARPGAARRACGPLRRCRPRPCRLPRDGRWFTYGYSRTAIPSSTIDRYCRAISSGLWCPPGRYQDAATHTVSRTNR